MAAANPVLRLPPPAQIAEGVGKIAPVDLSKSPLLGILGVIIGAGIVTLTGRMPSAGRIYSCDGPDTRMIRLRS